MLISESYKELNKQLHDSRPDYGTSGHRYVGVVKQLIERHSTTDVLDYGAGKRTLEQALGFPITNYDPCVPGLESIPGPHDLVVCTDVLEHIEPDCLLDVLRDIRRCAKKCALLLVSTVPAQKTLADGRNAHLIQQPYEWWEEALKEAKFRIMQRHDRKGEFVVVCE